MAPGRQLSALEKAVAERLASVRSRLDALAGPGRAKVVAVTKGFGPPEVQAACSAGLFDLGENYAQELLRKSEGAPAEVQWHFLGALQRNKLGRLVPYIHLWQGLDSQSGARALATRSPGAQVLVEVNLAGGGSRRGLPLNEVPALVEKAVEAGLTVRGLMAVGPEGASAYELQTAFSSVTRLCGRLGLPEVSMGMSDDFEIAAGEGSTMVRLGRALFGPRPRPDRPPWSGNGGSMLRGDLGRR